MDTCCTSANQKYTEEIDLNKMLEFLTNFYSMSNMSKTFEFIESNYITKEVQSRINKKHRINKKWIKRYGYKRITDDDNVMVFENKIIGSKKSIEKFKSKIIS
jgi:hypothetical protein